MGGWVSKWFTGTPRDRILLAAPLQEGEIVAAFADQLDTEERLEESGGGRLRVKRITRLGRLALREQVDDNPDPALIAEALADRVRREGLGGLPIGPAADALRARVDFLRRLDESWPDLSDAALIARLDEWLTPLLTGVRSLAALKPDALDAALRALIPWERQRGVYNKRPGHLETPPQKKKKDARSHFLGGYLLNSP